VEAHLNDIDIACILSGLARGHFYGEQTFLRTVSERWLKIFSNSNIQTLSTALHSLTRLAVMDDRFMDDIRDNHSIFPRSMEWLTTDMIKGLTELIQSGPKKLRAITMTIWSLGKLRVRHPGFEAAALSLLESTANNSITDMIATVASLASLGVVQVLPIAHDLLGRVDVINAPEIFPVIHLLWSIGLLEGSSSSMTSAESCILSSLFLKITERSDASMLYHYMQMRGAGIDYPFGHESWESTNNRWVVDSEPGTVERTVFEWFAQLPNVATVKFAHAVSPGLVADILVEFHGIHGSTIMVPVEVNGPSHYVYYLDDTVGSLRMELDLKTRRRNELILSALQTTYRQASEVWNISYIDYNKLCLLSVEEREEYLEDALYRAAKRVEH
jgi:hypothetical protein